jgi:hypothetical protein
MGTHDTEAIQEAIDLLLELKALFNDALSVITINFQNETQKVQSLMETLKSDITLLNYLIPQNEG